MDAAVADVDVERVSIARIDQRIADLAGAQCVPRYAGVGRALKTAITSDIHGVRIGWRNEDTRDSPGDHSGTLCPSCSGIGGNVDARSWPCRDVTGGPFSRTNVHGVRRAGCNGQRPNDEAFLFVPKWPPRLSSIYGFPYTSTGSPGVDSVGICRMHCEGFDAPVDVSRSNRNPGRSSPRGIISCLMVRSIALAFDQFSLMVECPV